MKRKQAYTLLLIAAFISGLSIAKKPPNILFIAVDDLKPSINCFGDDFAITPNIDRLAETGTVFQNNHCQQALCGPSRASIMTGLRPDTLGIWFFGQRMREIRPETVTMPEFFKNSGYETTAIGKIYDPRNVNDRVDPESWSIPHKTRADHIFHPDHPEPIPGHYQSDKARNAYNEARAKGLTQFNDIFRFMKTLEANPPVERLDYNLPDNAYTDGGIAMGAVEILKDLSKREKPFFFAVGFWKPHLAFTAPKKYWDLYDRSEISVHPYQHKSKNAVDVAYHTNGELKGYANIPPNFDSYSENDEDHLPEETQIELIHGYYAATSYIDAQVGRLLDALEDIGIADNTIIVLWGDHGFHLGDHGLWHKHSNFEQATRSPLVISAPGIDKQVVTSAPTEFIDVFPTLCELAGLKAPVDLDGVSLTPLMKGQKQTVKPIAVSQYPRGDLMGYSIRTERYRYTEWINNWRTSDPYDPELVHGRELYDYLKDPMETSNVAADPHYSETLSELQNLMQDFFEESRKAGATANTGKPQEAERFFH